MGGWAMAGAAILSAAGGIQGSQAAQEAAQNQKRLLRMELRETLIASYRKSKEIQGIQQTSYAAGGVSVDVGSPKLIQEQAVADLGKANYYESLKTKYMIKGAQSAGSAASSGYLSQGLGNALQQGAAAYTAFKTP